MNDEAQALVYALLDAMSRRSFLSRLGQAAIGTMIAPSALAKGTKVATSAKPAADKAQTWYEFWRRCKDEIDPADEEYTQRLWSHLQHSIANASPDTARQLKNAQPGNLPWAEVARRLKALPNHVWDYAYPSPLRAEWEKVYAPEIYAINAEFNRTMSKNKVEYSSAQKPSKETSNREPEEDREPDRRERDSRSRFDYAGGSEDTGYSAYAEALVRSLIGEAAENQEWIGVDLDGTLARYTKWKGSTHIGTPIPRMVRRLRRWVSHGKKVKIFTARADDEKSVNAIKKWLKDNDLPELEITNIKDQHMTELWDDRAVAVQKNTGKVKEG